VTVSTSHSAENENIPYAGPTGLGLTALDPDFREDPYPVLAELRDREPVHWDDVLKRFIITRHADVNMLLRDLDLWMDARKGNPGTFSREFLVDTAGQSINDNTPSMLMLDDPEHRRLRDLVRRSFTPKAIESWRDRIRGVAERLIAGIDRGPFDLVKAYADPLPTVVIAEMLGIDPERHAEFKEWSSLASAVGFNPAPTPEQVASGEAAAVSLDAFFLDEIKARKSRPGNDLITSMVTAEVDGDHLSDVEIVSQCNLLLVAGNITTTDLIGNTIKAMIDFPDEQERIAADPGLIPGAIDEVLRFDGPVTNSGRIANRDLELHGVKIGKGESLSLSVAAGNRDPRYHETPDTFDLDREDKSTLAFGGGHHFCLGAYLAKVEASEAVRALHQKMGAIQLAEGGYQRSSSPSFRGFTQLLVEPASR
jgi:cytochrome P450